MNLYHYCSADKCFSILKGKNIRLTDISKSNDAAELALLFPDLLHVIFDKYMDNPFPFKYDGLSDMDAMYHLIQVSEKILRNQFETGSFTNFVVCFSEVKDCLSQWRGYANDGKGCCLGFSKDILQQFCDSTKGVLRLEKVEYVTQKEIDNRIETLAQEILDELCDLREWIVENMTQSDDSDDTDGLLGFNFSMMLQEAFIDSLSLKYAHFSEEHEWRILFANRPYKEPDWIFKKNEKLTGPNLFNETLAFLNNRVDFMWTDNDLISFCPLKFDEFSIMPITELLLGPKSRVLNSDMILFLKKYGYPEIKIQPSLIPYR